MEGGRPTKREVALKEAWENAVAILDTLLENARDDFEAGRLMSKSRIREIDLALDTIRRQRSALFSQGLIWEGEE
jgi:hypothetical protein